MTRREGRSQGRASLSFAAWLSFVAMGIQIFIPVLLGIEIGVLTASPALAGDMVICSTGHQSIPTDDSQAKGDHSHGAPCPICLALAAAAPVTGASPIFVPLPGSATGNVLPVPEVAALASVTPGSYRARAPPLSI